MRFGMVSVEDFKNTFKVGDIITFGCGTEVPIMITAIGEERILYRSLTRRKSEGVAKICAWDHRWNFFDPKNNPKHAQYAYVLDSKMVEQKFNREHGWY